MKFSSSHLFLSTSFFLVLYFLKLLCIVKLCERQAHCKPSRLYFVFKLIKSNESECCTSFLQLYCWLVRSQAVRRSSKVKWTSNFQSFYQDGTHVAEKGQGNNEQWAIRRLGVKDSFFILQIFLRFPFFSWDALFIRVCLDLFRFCTQSLTIQQWRIVRYRRQK